jgi:hypothetical protein
VYTRDPFTIPKRAEIACELVPIDFSAFVAAVLRLAFALDCKICDSFGNICTEPVRFLKGTPPALLVLFWFWALAACCVYVTTKVPLVIDAVTANTAIINKFLFLVIISFFVSPLN